MSDLISRQAAIDALEEPCKVPETWTDEYAVGERAQYEKDVKALNSLPAAERREGQPSECEYWDDESNFCALNRPSAERHGRWIKNETSYADPPTKQTCNCSICGKASTRPLGDWCRWCGSRMDLDCDTE